MHFSFANPHSGVPASDPELDAAKTLDAPRGVAGVTLRCKTDRFLFTNSRQMHDLNRPKHKNREMHKENISLVYHRCLTIDCLTLRRPEGPSSPRLPAYPPPPFCTGRFPSNSSTDGHKCRQEVERVDDDDGSEGFVERAREGKSVKVVLECLRRCL